MLPLGLCLLLGCSEAGESEDAANASPPPESPIAETQASEPASPESAASGAPPDERAPEAPEISGAAFRDAAFNGNLVTVARGVKQGVAVDAAGEQDRTALMLAAYNSHNQVVQYLLDSGAKVDLRDATGRTALMYAATGPDAETLTLLLRAGADIDAADGEEHWTPLMFAAAEGHVPVVQTLLDHGAKRGAKDIDGENALQFAINNGHAEAAQLLRDE